MRLRGVAPTTGTAPPTSSCGTAPSMPAMNLTNRARSPSSAETNLVDPSEDPLSKITLSSLLTTKVCGNTREPTSAVPFLPQQQDKARIYPPAKPSVQQ